MIKDKISSQEIIGLFATNASITKRVAEEFIKSVFATIEQALLAGETVKIKGLGTFKLQWNEQRKSVNVNNGEELVLAGHYKVSFTPEVALKELVNEPFAHLEAVELDGDGTNTTEADKLQDDVIDPLRIFNEQASEILGLLSEINNIKTECNLPIENEVIIDEPESELSKIDKSIDLEPLEVEAEVLENLPLVMNTAAAPIEIVEPIVSSIEPELDAVESVEMETPIEESDIVSQPLIIPESNTSITPPVFEDISRLSDNPNVKELNSKLFLKDVKPLHKKSTGSKIIISLVVVILFSCITVLFYYFPVGNYCQTVYGNFKSTFLVPPKVQKRIVRKKLIIIKKVIRPKQQIVTVDELQQLFDNKRVYSTFIASERIAEGSRLARMSLKYYGHSDFWVYIYEANKAKIPNPDDIAFGTLIRIPKLDPRLIDAKNERCIKQARILHDLYVKKKKF